MGFFLLRNHQPQTLRCAKPKDQQVWRFVARLQITSIMLLQSQQDNLGQAFDHIPRLLSLAISQLLGILGTNPVINLVFMFRICQQVKKRQLKMNWGYYGGGLVDILLLFCNASYVFAQIASYIINQFFILLQQNYNATWKFFCIVF